VYLERITHSRSSHKITRIYIDFYLKYVKDISGKTVSTQQGDAMPAKKRDRVERNELKEILITKSGSYRSVAYHMNDSGPNSYFIRKGTFGILQGKAPGAPDLMSAAVEYGKNETVSIEVGPGEYTPA
jgi:hypothetical protein